MVRIIATFLLILACVAAFAQKSKLRIGVGAGLNGELSQSERVVIITVDGPHVYEYQPTDDLRLNACVFALYPIGSSFSIYGGFQTRTHYHNVLFGTANSLDQAYSMSLPRSSLVSGQTLEFPFQLIWSFNDYVHLSGGIKPVWIPDVNRSLLKEKPPNWSQEEYRTHNFLVKSAHNLFLSTLLGGGVNLGHVSLDFYWTLNLSKKGMVVPYQGKTTTGFVTMSYIFDSPFGNKKADH